jgi:expansin (peptidoglycan-binding protein)
MQVINAKVAVKSLEVSTDGGNTWQGTTRVDYNYFQNAAGFGTDTVNVRVTSVDGEVIVVNGVPVTSNLEVAASRNF